MKIQTFSIVVGTKACDANCPFCISHTTGFENLPKTPDVNLLNLLKAIQLAKMCGTTTVLLTGKGEPTLYPANVKYYLQRVGTEFPFIELQTNAIQMGYLAAKHKTGFAGHLPSYGKLTPGDLKSWWTLGLNTIAISTVGIHQRHNGQVYRKPYPVLSTTIKYLHDFGYSIRLCVMMCQGKVDSRDKVREVVEWCKSHGVEQLTVRPIRRPTPKPGSLNVLNQSPEDAYISENGLTAMQEADIRGAIDSEATHIMTLMNGAHEARVYDWDGQNICISDCLTVEPKSDEIRTLIFYGDGKLMYDWQYDGARLL